MCGCLIIRQTRAKRTMGLRVRQTTNEENWNLKQWIERMDDMG
jgi:hypothetical protein